MFYGGIEAGGTKFICAVADETLTIIEKISIKTTTPEETLAQVIAFFKDYELKSLGIGSFGPIGIQKGTKEYGHILSTPKKGWTDFDLLGRLKEAFNVPTAFTTDVNAAAFGEWKKGAAKGKDSCIYLTIGTGIGGGIIHKGEIFEGISHPEMGHIPVQKEPTDTFKGNCPYHEGCLEGLAAGPSLEARTGIKGESLPKDHPVWQLQAYYLAQALVSYTLTLAPEIIILGGGVINQEHLLKEIRQQFTLQMNGYMQTPEVEKYIVPWALPNQSGLLGTLLLAKEAYEEVSVPAKA